MLESVRYVDLVIPEKTWEQKIQDIKDYKVDIVVMGSDWAGSDKFDYLKDYCEVIYLDRTEGVSTTKIKKELHLQEPINGKDQIPNT
jgi:glycerol-3-phosphate cytidylyltransferase